MRARTIVRTNDELSQWLDEVTWFEDCLALELWPLPASAHEPRLVRIVLGEQVSGGYRAGEERRVQEYGLMAVDVTRSTLGPDLSFSPGNCCSGIELLPAEGGIAFRIDVPGTLDVRCRQLVIEPKALRDERVEPWLSSREIRATLRGMQPPLSDEWLARFRAAGVDACWRQYGGDARLHPADPGSYEGWFLQRRERVHQTSGGLLFFVCRERDGGVALQWQLWGEDDPAAPSLWSAAQQVIAAFDPPTVWCGNVEFSGPEWRRYVETGELPKSALGENG